MADEYFIKDPVSSDNMRENADFFETLAIEVHNATTEDDSQYQAPCFVGPLYIDSVEWMDEGTDA
jgi:hypothetical protein